MSYQYRTVGGVGVVTFAVTAGALPAGLSMSTSGLITGTTTTAEHDNAWTVTATDSDGNTAVLADTAYVLDLLGTPTEPTAEVAYSYTLTGTEGTAPYTFVKTSGSLPTGFTLASGGEIACASPIADDTGTFTVTMTDALGVDTFKSYVLGIPHPAAGDLLPSLIEWFTFDDHQHGMVNTGLAFQNWWGGGAVHAYSDATKTRKAMLSVSSFAVVGGYTAGQSISTYILAYIDATTPTNNMPVVIGFGQNNSQTIYDSGFNTIEIITSGGTATANLRCLDGAAYVRSATVALNAGQENMFGMTFDTATNIWSLRVNDSAPVTVALSGNATGVYWYYVSHEIYLQALLYDAFDDIPQVLVDEWGTFANYAISDAQWDYFYNDGDFKSYAEFIADSA